MLGLALYVHEMDPSSEDGVPDANKISPAVLPKAILRVVAFAEASDYGSVLQDVDDLGKMTRALVHADGRIRASMNAIVDMITWRLCSCSSSSLPRCA